MTDMTEAQKMTTQILQARTHIEVHVPDSTFNQQYCQKCNMQTLWQIPVEYWYGDNPQCLTCIALEDSSWQDLLNPI
jgi:hypothetical protein